MKNESLDFNNFKKVAILYSKTRSINGKGTPTSRSGFHDGSNGPDLIDDCTDRTTFSNGTNSNDIVK